MSSYDGVATLESWLRHEVFGIHFVPSYIVERYERWRQPIEMNLEDYLGRDDGDGLPSWRDWNCGFDAIDHRDEFDQLTDESKRLLGIHEKPHWNQRTGLEGIELPVTGEWLLQVGLTIQTHGAEIPTIPIFKPLRMAIGAHNGQWFAAINTHKEIVIVRPVATRSEVMDLCKALKITLPVTVEYQSPLILTPTF